MAYALRGGGDALLVESESVEFAGVHAVGFGLVHVERVGCGDVVRMLVECVGDGVEQLVFGFGVCLGKLRLRGAGCVAHGAYCFEHVGVHGGALVLWIRHSLLE